MPTRTHYQFIEGGVELAPRIRPLWEGLREHHRVRSTWFSRQLANFTFEQRWRHLVEKGEGGFRADLVHDPELGRDVAYCVSTIDREGAGEVDTLFVMPDARGQGLADELMLRHMGWLRDRDAHPISLVVAVGNEEVLDFYRRYGFEPRHTTMLYRGEGHRLW